MGRQPRPTFPGLIYHIVNRGNDRQQVFLCEDDLARYLQILRRYREQYGFSLFHYVLMDNHIHLLLQTSGGGTVSKIMQSITLAHTRYHNDRYERSGHLWQGRFRSSVVERDSYLLECGRYIELNPVRAGLVQDPGEYRWSSYRFHAFREPNKLLSQHPLAERFGETEEGACRMYRKFIGSGVPEEIAREIRHSIKGDHALGGDRFVKELKGKVRRRRKSRRTGRPRKVSV